MKQTMILTALISLTACASSGSGWSRTDWLSQQARNFNSGPWKMSAVPVRGDGFKLKFSINLTDIAAGSTADGGLTDLTETEMIEAAKAAAPDGCSFISLSPTEDGSFEADYDCG